MNLEFKQYDVVMVNLPEVESGSNKQAGSRPAVIIQNDVGNKFSPTLLVIPMTTRIKALNKPTHALIRKDTWNGLWKDSMILAEQVTPVDKSSVEKIGEIRNPVAQRQILTCFLNEALFGLNFETIKVRGGKVCTA